VLGSKGCDRALFAVCLYTAARIAEACSMLTGKENESMNPHNQNNYFSFNRGILALTLEVNLLSLSFFSEINQKAVWAKSETNIISNITPVLQLNNRGLLLA